MSLIHLEILVFVVIHTAANTFSQSTIHSVMKTSKKVQKFGRGKSKIVIGLSLLSSLAKQFHRKKELISYIIIVCNHFFLVFLPFMAIFPLHFRIFL